MRLLVTGAAGFLGRRLVDRLVALGHDVLAIDRNVVPDELASTRGVVWLQRDIARDSLESDDLAGVETVFHLAGATLGAGQDEWRFLGANEATTVRLLQACAGSARTVVVASSQVVYGDAKCIGVTEEFPLLVTGSAYACSRVNSENWVRWFERKHGGLYLVLRFSGFVEGGGAIDYMIGRALKNAPIELFSRGTVRRDYLAVGRGIEAMIGALAYRGPTGVVPINVGSGQALSSFELAELICAELGSTSEIVRSSAPAPQADFVFDIQRARAYLGFDPGDLRDAVRAHAQRGKTLTGRG
jgi:nucleoside-diphosphate-sugar epimerase